MNRRGFLKGLLGSSGVVASAVAAGVGVGGVDVEELAELLWTPKKTIFIPPASGAVTPASSMSSDETGLHIQVIRDYDIVSNRFNTRITTEMITREALKVLRHNLDVSALRTYESHFDTLIPSIPIGNTLHIRRPQRYGKV